MTEATIRFEGKAYQWVKWTEILTDSGFRVTGFNPEKAVYASRGNNILAEGKGFLTPDEAYAWHLTLKQTRRWEGSLKFYSILLAAFSVPQAVTVAVAGQAFRDREALRIHAANALITEFSLEELLQNGVYQKGYGIRFG